MVVFIAGGDCLYGAVFQGGRGCAIVLLVWCGVPFGWPATAPLIEAKGAVERQKCRSKAKGTQKIPDNYLPSKLSAVLRYRSSRLRF
jgi:hypothetical protein